MGVANSPCISTKNFSQATCCLMSNKYTIWLDKTWIETWILWNILSSQFKIDKTKQKCMEREYIVLSRPVPFPLLRGWCRLFQKQNLIVSSFVQNCEFQLQGCRPKLSLFYITVTKWHSFLRMLMWQKSPSCSRIASNDLQHNYTRKNRWLKKRGPINQKPDQTPQSKTWSNGFNCFSFYCSSDQFKSLHNLQVAFLQSASGCNTRANET